MDKYLALEKRLAELLYPEFNIVVDDIHGGFQLFSKAHKTMNPVTTPNWCRDWSACGPLMVEHGCYPTGHQHTIVVDALGRWDGKTFVGGYIKLAWVNVADHPNKNVATMCAIVMAVIAKLEAKS